MYEMPLIYDNNKANNKANSETSVDTVLVDQQLLNGLPQQEVMTALVDLKSRQQILFTRMASLEANVEGVGCGGSGGCGHSIAANNCIIEANTQRDRQILHMLEVVVNKRNGYFRDQSDCAKMIRCSNGKITHRFTCSEGKVFNDITKSCDDPKYVNCHNSATLEMTTSPSSISIEEPRYELPKAVPLQVDPYLFRQSRVFIPTYDTTHDIENTETPHNVDTDITITPSNETSDPKNERSLRVVKHHSIIINDSFVEYEEESKPRLNKSFVEYEEESKPRLNKSFVEYEERFIKPLNNSFVIYEEDKDNETIPIITTTIATTSPTTIITTTEVPLEMTTIKNIESITLSSVIPTTIDSIVLPVLETILQNETLTETTVTESTYISTNTESTESCVVEDSVAGLHTVLSNYKSNDMSKITDFYKIVCYFTNWSRYRSDLAKYTPNNINPFLCTHIIYAFAILDNKTLTMKSSDKCTDIDNRFYQRVTDLKEKNPKLKVLIALGGWVDSEGDKYSRLVRNYTNRMNFIERAIEFIRQHNFDGLDLDWEYPQCWQSDCSAGTPSDKLNFAKFIRELRTAFNRQPKPLLLTAAVGAAKHIVDNAYEINSLMVNLDFINLMSYDYYTTGSPIAAHHSQLYSHPNAKDMDNKVLNANFSVNYWIKKGFPSHKIILGIPFYGRTFKLVDSEINDFGSPVNGTGDQGIYTKENGFIAYYEICANILQKGWAKRTDSYVLRGNPLITGPYSYTSNQWVGYDDRDHIIQKTDFIKNNNLGGAMIWALDLDDFNGICCHIMSPLLKTINKELREYKFDLKKFCP
ncbi:uncharacterized protein LOC128958065 [Oppia nitens]|uniref:uncharacterized protein LOC128958065 n=1 Tax=Oppia nitens TaxID=1686743 RepID=UPI0023DBEB0C|nr:uncharacterized protein LOC128958065 [Oppia nitens]